MAEARLTTASSFKVATYNVWFGWDGWGSPYGRERMEAIVNLLKSQNASESSSPLAVCGFQEVIPELSETALKPILKQAGYTLVCQPGLHYKCALAVHDSLEIVEQDWRPFENSDMQRGFLYVRFRLPSHKQQVLFATTHLESPTNKEGTTNVAERVHQIRVTEKFCNEQMKRCSSLSTAIISGDLNWDEQARDVPLLTRGLETSWKDAWLETHNAETEEGFTFDCPLNPFLDGERRGRLDRILVRDGSFYQPQETSLIGQGPISEEFTIQKSSFNEEQGNNDEYSTPVKRTRNVPIVPSDHFGVVAYFRSTTS